jgi:hypothetical protein
MRSVLVVLVVLGISLPMISAQYQVGINTNYPCFFSNASTSLFPPATTLYGFAFYNQSPAQKNTTQRMAQQFALQPGADWNVTAIRFSVFSSGNSLTNVKTIATGFFDFYADTGNNLPVDSFSTYKLFSQYCQGGGITQDQPPVTSYSNILALYRCDLVTPILLSAGTTYWLVLSVANSSNAATYTVFYFSNTDTPSTSLVAAYRGSGIPSTDPSSQPYPYGSPPTPLDVWSTSVFTSPGQPLQFCFGFEGTSISLSTASSTSTTGSSSGVSSSTTGGASSSADGSSTSSSSSSGSLDSGPAHVLKPFSFF